MTRRPRRRMQEPRACFYCGREIPDLRPVWLVAESHGKILGPYHAHCAADVAAAARELRNRGLTPGLEYGRMIRGEELT